MKSALFVRIGSLLLGAVACVALLSASATQETPRGGLRVTVTMEENGKPLPKAWVTLTSTRGDIDIPAFSVAGEELQPMHRAGEESHRYRADAAGVVDVSNLAAGAYTIQADAKAHSVKPELVVIEEAKTNDVTLKLAPSSPYLDLYASQRVFTPGEQPSIQISGFSPTDAATVFVYRLDLDKIVAKGGLERLLYSFSRPGNEGGSDPSKSAVHVEKVEKQLNSQDIEGVFTEPVTLPTLPMGFYYVTCAVGTQTRATYLSVSKIGMATKTSGNNTLCFVSDLQSGEPIAGATILTAANGRLRPTTKTDAKGVATLTLPPGDEYKALVLAAAGDSRAVVDVDRRTLESEDFRTFIYADRPIYRPGDTIQFKGIVRRLQGSNYVLPGGGEIDVKIRDSDETPIKEFKLPVSAQGSFHGSFTTNDEDKPGSYSIETSYHGSTYSYWIPLAAYRKPEFSIDVSAGRKFFVYGERASATVKAEYYFGGPVIGAKVEAYITRSPHFEFDDDYDGDYEDYGAGSYQGEYREKVEAVTNAKGEAVISFETQGKDDPEIADVDYDYTINASITDASNKYFDATGTVLVTRGDVDAELTTDRYIAAPGETIEASVTVTHYGDESAVPGRSVQLVVGTEEWTGDTAVFHPQRTLTGTTDAKGVARIPVKVQGEGSLVLKSTVLDDAGRPVKSSDYLYVEGAGYLGPATSKFTLTLDKKRYALGDTCRVMLETDKPGGSALITVEADKVLARYVVPISKRSTMFTIPVEHAYAPNVWVSATAIRDKQLLESQRRLVVDVHEHDLNISITPDKTAYLPGELANLTVRTTDANGRPVPADLAVAVVDESIYAIHADTANIARDLYPMREDRVGTNYSFEQIYLDGGDKAGGDIPVRSKFLDTAAWFPSVETNAQGIGHAQVKLPDNLTSWRVTAIGATADTKVGMAHVNFKARKLLSVRLQLPSFLVQQDRQRITAIVTNNTSQDQEVTVRLEASGLKVEGDLTAKVVVPADKPQNLTWFVQAPDSGEATLTAYALASPTLNDAERRSLTVQPHGRLSVESRSGAIQNGAGADFRLSPNADPNEGRLQILVSPSLGTVVYQSLDELIAFPYGCTEQTMSRFLPTVLLASTLERLNIRSDLQAKAPGLVAEGFARLAKMQHSDGSWGWWEYDSGDPYMTAYVLDGVQRAKQAGYENRRVNIQSALEWAKTYVKTGGYDPKYPTDMLYLIYALAAYGQGEAAQAGLARVAPVDSESYALAAMAYAKLGDANASRRELANLRKLMVVQGEIASFPANEAGYGCESVAFPLIALTTLVPNDPAIPKLVRYLVASRQGDFWSSTRDSSLALIGLIQHLGFSPDFGKPIDIQVKIDGTTTRTVHFDPSDQFNPRLRIVVPIRELRAGTVHLSFATNGSGAFFSADLRQIERAPTLAPQPMAGLSVVRTYHRLEPQRMESGALELRPTKESITEARTGDLIRVDLDIASAVDRQFIMIEDPIPSGCRITEREYVDDGEEWTAWWTQTIVRDDKAAFFMRRLKRGTQRLTYTMRAEQIGLGHALPTTISNMYDPTVSASGGETILTVTP